MEEKQEEKYIPYDSIQYLNKKKYIDIWGHKLPHWFQENKTVFATFRLADSLPKERIEELRDDIKKMKDGRENDECRDARIWKILEKMESWLNNGYGSCCLSDYSLRKVVADALHHYDGKLYTLHSFVIMPNHVHVLLSPLGNMPVLNSLGKVKSYTAKEINRRKGQTGRVWQHGIFDRLIRDACDFTAKWDYIADNPKKLPKDTFTYYMRK